MVSGITGSVAWEASRSGSNDSNTLGISYLFVGFGQPINADSTRIFGGRVIPIKIRLVDANGDPVTDATPMVWLASYDKDLGLGEDWEQVSSASKADTDNIMRYVPADLVADAFQLQRRQWIGGHGVADQVVGGLADRGLVSGGGPAQPGCQIDVPADGGVVQPALRTKVTDHRLSGDDADADGGHLQADAPPLH